MRNTQGVLRGTIRYSGGGGVYSRVLTGPQTRARARNSDRSLGNERRISPHAHKLSPTHARSHTRPHAFRTFICVTLPLSWDMINVSGDAIVETRMTSISLECARVHACDRASGHVFVCVCVCVCVGVCGWVCICVSLRVSRSIYVRVRAGL
jgi:hypothetical protein